MDELHSYVSQKN